MRVSLDINSDIEIILSFERLEYKTGSDMNKTKISDSLDKRLYQKVTQVLKLTSIRSICNS